MHKAAGRIAEDVESADLSGVSGTPSFFINGHRYQDASDIQTLTKAVELAGTRARVNTPGDPAGNAPTTQVAGPAEANRLTDS